MTQKVFTAVPFKPTTSLTGNEAGIIRGQNMIMEGTAPNIYFRAYKGSYDMSETASTEVITGTISFSPSSTTITGVGTAFLDELHLGQMIQASEGEVIVVGQLLTPTTFKADRLPFATGSGEAATRLGIIGELNINRFTMLRGNAVQFDRGTILAVGDGVLRVNGSSLAGDSLIASRQVQVAVYDSATMTYDVQPVGFEEVPVVVNGDVTIIASGGTKNMSVGYYSFKVSYYSDITNGFGNPTATLLESGTDGYHITVANSTIEIDFTGDVGNRPAKATGYVIYGSAYSGSEDISQTNAIQGGWFEVTRVAFADLVSQAHVFEYTDSELGTLVSFDNDMPPDAEFISTIDLYPFLVSTDGQGVDSTGRETSTSPGAFVAPAKPENLDAYPAAYKVPTGKGETILGVVSAAGRFFVMTPNSLQAVTPTGLPSAPFTCRPFWRRGFVNPYNLIFIDDTLYGYSGKKLFRSTGTADTANESYEFASDVEAQLAESSGGYVFIAHDPKNELICVFLSAIRQNDSGYWETDVYPYSLTKSVWTPKIVLTSTTQDMIVSGAATVNNELYFVAGGRVLDPVPPLNPLARHACCTGACGLNVHSTAENDVSIDTVNTRGDGTHAIKMVAEWTMGSLLQGVWQLPTNYDDYTYTDGITYRFYINYEQLPVWDPNGSPGSFPNPLGAFLVMAGVEGVGADQLLGLAYEFASGTFKCCRTNPLGSATIETFAATGSGVIVADTWYRVDLRIYIDDSNTAHVEAQVDGVDIEAVTVSVGVGYTVAAPTILTNRGGYPSVTIQRIADVIFTGDYTDYPIGAGVVRQYLPGSDGTHNILAAGAFTVGNTASNITNSTMNSYTLIDKDPMPYVGETQSGNVFIRQVATAGGGAGQYVEHSFTSNYTPARAPRLVQYLAQPFLVDSAGNGNGKIVVDSGITEMFDFTTVLIGEFSLAPVASGMSQSPVTEEEWTLTGFAQLKSRFGYAEDIVFENGDIGLQSLMIEAEFPTTT